MGKKMKAHMKKNKKTVNIEYEYTGDIKNFDDFASFYRRRNAMLNNNVKRLSKPVNEDLYMECANEYKFYYDNILHLDKKKSPLDILSELAYLDYYRNNTLNDKSLPRKCILGHKNCMKKDCWMEKCRVCIDKVCSTCSLEKLDIINDYFGTNSNNSPTQGKPFGEKNS